MREATRSLSPSVVPNEDRFEDDPFFRRFPRTHLPPLSLGDGIEKTYPSPSLIQDAQYAVAVFPCDLHAARRAMPHRAVRPVTLSPGRAVAIVSFYDYRTVLNLPGYLEMAVSIPVTVQQPITPPLLPMVIPGYPGFGYQVLSMPVTSRENEIRGHRIWGLPKTVHNMEFEPEGSDAVGRIAHPDGTVWFELRVPRAGGTPRSVDLSSWVYSTKGHQLLRSKLAVQGRFSIRSNPRVILGKAQPSRPLLWLGDGQQADLLRQLRLEAQPFQLRYGEHIKAAFHSPDPLFSLPLHHD